MQDESLVQGAASLPRQEKASQEKGEQEVTDQDRIRLAKAMGIDPNGGYVSADHAREYGVIFDPLTDANDDYAVLEWAIEEYGGEKMEKALRHVGMADLWAYEVGTWSQATLAIMNGEIDTCPCCIEGAGP